MNLWIMKITDHTSGLIQQENLLKCPGKHIDQNSSKQNQSCANLQIPQGKDPFLPLLLSHNKFVSLPRSEDVEIGMGTSVAGAVNPNDVFNKLNTCEQVLNGNFYMDKVLFVGRQNTNRQ